MSPSRPASSSTTSPAIKPSSLLSPLPWRESRAIACRRFPVPLPVRRRTGRGTGKRLHAIALLSLQGRGDKRLLGLMAGEVVEEDAGRDGDIQGIGAEVHGDGDFAVAGGDEVGG